MKIEPKLVGSILAHTYENWTYRKEHDFVFPEFEADTVKNYINQMLSEDFVGYQNKRESKRPDILLDKGIRLFEILNIRFIRNEILEELEKLENCNLEDFYDLSVFISSKYEH